LELETHAQCIDALIQTKKVNFANLVEIRLYIEPEVARSVAVYPTRKEIDGLREVLDKTEGTMDTLWKKAPLRNVQQVHRYDP